MLTADVGGCAVDFGAHWVGPAQRRLLALASELGIEVEKQYLDGKHLLAVGGERRSYSSLPLLSIPGTLDMGRAVARTELRRLLVNAEAPWRSRRARRLDSYTLAHHMRGLRTDGARGLFTIIARTVFGAEPSEISFLYFLWYAQCAGGVMALSDFEGGAQDAHFVGGSQQICERIAGELGDDVLLGMPATRIRQDANGVSVDAGGRTIRAERAVVAISPSMAGRIEFDPAVPAPREALSQRMPMGAYMKGVAVYDHAWWRDRGLSGLALADRGPVQFTVDVSPPGGRPGVLAGFITGAPAREVSRLAGDERRRVVLDAMGSTLAPEAANARAYRDLNWVEERWSRGGPVGLMGPGTLTGLGPALREPVGRIHWAGTETATSWPGYMEGAIQAGERAAVEAAAA
jgi:monoamine oxidase